MYSNRIRSSSFWDMGKQTHAINDKLYTYVHSGLVLTILQAANIKKKVANTLR